MNSDNIVNVPGFFKERYSTQNKGFVAKRVVKNAIRVNTLKIGEEELVKTLRSKGVKLRKIAWLRNAYEYESEFSLGSTIEFLSGFYFLQEAASQIPVEVLSPKSGDVVLDMSAAPGAKTTQISQSMNNKGVVVALDISNPRIRSLGNNLERMGVENCVVYNKDARYASDLGIVFDKVLLDAPCTGNYCIEDSWFLKRSIEDIKKSGEVQKQLISEAYDVLRKGGELVYSTCSLEVEEDEDVVRWAVKELGFKLEKVSLGVGVDTGFGVKLWPHKTGTQGFFISKLIKK
ncbi:RsmB/NOP family class I SAM-dependent RNA methyltransferase [Candidatus Woesearchaeota archaeon]|nr:RsmB/NOP family class I SAM-dependent RNA methyltransferase [Candidatus Woesearchaeota archaeon]